MDQKLYDEVNQRANLNCMEEEADSRLNFHVANARVEGFKKVLVLPNDSDVVTQSSAYFDKERWENDAETCA